MKFKWSTILFCALACVILAPVLNVMVVTFLALLGIPHWGISEEQVIGSIIWLLSCLIVTAFVAGSVDYTA